MCVRREGVLSERYVVTFEPASDPLNRPPEVRLRMLLKLALRGLALRVVDVRGIDTERASVAGNRGNGHCEQEQRA